MEHTGGTEEVRVALRQPAAHQAGAGAETDQKDSEWVADLLQQGLLRGSFVPPLEIRRMRDLTRMRAKIRQNLAAFANCIQKVLEDANIKLGSVASDALGVSGRSMLIALMAGQRDPKRLTDLARGRLREKLEDLQLALEEHFSARDRVQLKMLFEFLEFSETQFSKLEAEIRRLLTQVQQEPSRPDPLKTAEAILTIQTSPLLTPVQLSDTIPGIDELTASTLMAEIGSDMGQFPSPHHLASWAGLCPGNNNESAGNRCSRKTRKGSVWLRRAFCQAAWAASRTKDIHLAAQYRRLIVRRGKKRTIVAVAHSMLNIAYHLLNRRSCYQDLGADYFERSDMHTVKYRFVNRLTGLGYHVMLTPARKTV